MPRKDHFAVTLALHNVSSLEGGPKREKDKTPDRGRDKEKRSKWRPSISASVNDFAERSMVMTSVPSLCVEDASTIGDRRRSSGSTTSTVTGGTISTLSAGSGGLLTPIASSSSSSHSGSSRGSGEAILRQELGEYAEPVWTSKAWAEYVNAPDNGSRPRSSRRPSSSSAVVYRSQPLAPGSMLKIPPMPKNPPPQPPPPTAPLPSPPMTAPLPLPNFYTSGPTTHNTSPTIPLPKRPATSPATRRPTYPHSYPSSPEDILSNSHPLIRTSRSPPRPRPPSCSPSRAPSRPTSPLSFSAVSPGPPPEVSLPPLPDTRPRRASTPTLSPVSPSVLPFITSPSSPLLLQTEGQGASGQLPTSSLTPPLMMESTTESNVCAVPNTSLLLTSAISPPTTEMNLDTHRQQPMNKKPSPALLALWERQSRESGERGRYPNPRLYAAQQNQRAGAVFMSTLQQSPTSFTADIAASPPRSYAQRPGHSPVPPKAGVSPRAFNRTSLPLQVDEETASLLSLERRGELINIAVHEDSDSDNEARNAHRRLSTLSFMSNETSDPRLSGLIASFPITPTSSSHPPVTPFLNRPVRRAYRKPGSDSGDADDEGWDSDVDPQLTGYRTSRR